MTTKPALRQRLRELLAIGSALSTERDLPRLLERILETARTLAHADAGTLYRIEGDALRFEVIRNETLGFRMGGHSGTPIDFAPLPLYRPDGTPNHGMVVAHAALTKETVNIADAYDTPGFDFDGTRAFDARTGYRSQSFLTVPMLDGSGAAIGVLQLINARERDGRVRVFDADDQLLVESLASQAAVALDNRLLFAQQEKLFEALIQVINSAIDEKSPYTAGHCHRVPELTMMLAQATVETRDGPFADFSLSDADRHELRIAGLLHDCGKITTPVHVVDKATKLQTLYDRIGLIETRFEILLRDLALAYQQGEIDAETWAAERDAIARARALVRRSNVGTEAMSDADVAALFALATRSWTPDGGEPTPFLTDDERDNLVVRRGTLNPSERDIINRHIVITQQMLESLPWPRHLQRVPEFAGGHHERMDGRGYPRGLTRDQMSPQARMMGIADVFEALTAGDRPYKVGMRMSQAMRILCQMAVDQHIDRDLFEIFLRKRVYLDYAERFLTPEQRDPIDWNAMPGLSDALRDALRDHPNPSARGPGEPG